MTIDSGLSTDANAYANIGGAELESDDLEGLDIPVVPTGESLIVGVIKIKHTPRFDVLDVAC